MTEELMDIGEETRYYLKKGKFIQCENNQVTQCVMHHYSTWQRTGWVRLSGEQYQMVICYCEQCGIYWYHYSHEHQGSGGGCSDWLMQGIPGEAETLLHKKNHVDSECFRKILRDFEPTDKTKYIRDGIVCIVPEGYPWGVW